MPFGFHSQSDGTTAVADERGQKNNPKTCHINLSVSDEERDRVNFKNISRYKKRVTGISLLSHISETCFLTSVICYK